MRKLFGRIARFALLVWGIGFPIAGLGFNLYSVWSITGTELVTGTVTALVLHPDNDQPSYAPRFQYTTRDGEIHTVTSLVATNPHFEVGDSVPVRYKKNNPQFARIATFSQMWALGTIFMCIGPIFLSIYWLWKRRILRKQTEGPKYTSITEQQRLNL